MPASFRRAKSLFSRCFYQPDTASDKPRRDSPCRPGVARFSVRCDFKSEIILLKFCFLPSAAPFIHKAALSPPDPDCGRSDWLRGMMPAREELFFSLFFSPFSHQQLKINSEFRGEPCVFILKMLFYYQNCLRLII